jgi:hypothetical protein
MSGSSGDDDAGGADQTSLRIADTVAQRVPTLARGAG